MVFEYDNISFTIRTSKYALVLLFRPNDISEFNESYNIFNLQIGALVRISLDNITNV